ncbi:MAG TPA: HAD family phosphatase [Blastocatellia bacterium]|nr:HAD family phosphatase [Blastocatellia bacterium]
MTTKAILWDNDGVLVDTEHLYFRATRDVLASIGIELTVEMYVDLFLVDGKGAWHLAEQTGLTRNEVNLLRQRRNDAYKESLDGASTLIDGVNEALEALSGKFVMGVVTSSEREHFNIIHRSTGILDYFEFIIASGDYTRHKPDPEPYQVAVARTGFGTAECVAIEDSARGLASANRAGVECIVIPNQLTRTSDFSAARKILTSIHELPATLI